MPDTFDAIDAAIDATRRQQFQQLASDIERDAFEQCRKQFLLYIGGIVAGKRCRDRLRRQRIGLRRSRYWTRDRLARG